MPEDCKHYQRCEHCSDLRARLIELEKRFDQLYQRLGFVTWDGPPRIGGKKSKQEKQLTK